MTLFSIARFTVRASLARDVVQGLMAGTGLLVGSLAVSPAQADDLIVKYDQSQILRLSRPASEIIVGNPSVADVSVQSGNILIVTGKSFGITNIIALDGERNVIQDQRISVRRDEVGVVNLTRGTSRQTLACLPQCNPTMTVGDDLNYLMATIQASQSKMNFSEGNSSEKGQPQQ